MHLLHTLLVTGIGLAWIVSPLAAETAQASGLKDLYGYFPFAVPKDLKVWEARRQVLKKQVAISQGIYPMPAKTDLKPQVFEERNLGDYTISKVILEVMPGFMLTGTLFKPAEVTGKCPAVLCPHGHWPNGRHMERNAMEVAEEIKTGQETLVCAAQNPLQARCVHLARMGCIVFHYDMIGYADSTQLEHVLPHKFAKQTADRQGLLFSAAAEMQMQSIMGLQTWSSVRAVDFVSALPNVDATKIGVTGASGGATQTFLLAALDDRVSAVFPAVMVSTGMQGGCTCENACGLRVDTGNVELAALFAPKPMAMTTAHDWTEEMPTKGFPELQQLYGLFGKPENVSLTAQPQFPHNYNKPSREAMYAWFAKHLLGGKPVPAEREFPFQNAAALRVWTNAPVNCQQGESAEKALLAHWTKANSAALQADPQASAEALAILTGMSLATALVEKQDAPATVRKFPSNEPSKTVHLIVSGKGISDLVDAQDQPAPAVKTIIAKGGEVMGVSLKGHAENHATPGKQAKVANPREAAAYTYGYNRPLILQRVRQLLVLLAELKRDGKTIQLHSMAGGRRVVDLALRLAPGIPFEDQGNEPKYDFSQITDIYDEDFLPGALKYGW